MEVCSNFSNIEDMHKEADVVVKKATMEELKMLIPDPVKGAMSWAKNREYRAPHDQHAAAYWNRTLVAPEVIGLEPEEEEEAVEMVVRASELSYRTLPIDLDSGEDDEMMVQPENKNKNKAKATRRSNRLKGHRG
ncbi:hypothetical protein VPH35_058994 [Triticum aestivum]